MKYLFVLICVSSLLFGQQPAEKYIKSNFEKGLPAWVPVKWTNTLYSPINGGEFFNSMAIVSRDSLKTTNNFWLFYISETGISYTRCGFDKTGDNIYKSVVTLKNQDDDKYSPLKLILNQNDNTISYIWENKDKNIFDQPTIAELYPLKPGSTFPQINIETVDGRWTNKDNDKLIVINWWSTTCKPCVAEMPELNTLVDKYPKDKVEFIAICWDKENHSKFLSTHKFIYRQGFCDDYVDSLMGDTFPRNIIINKEGKILYNKTGYDENRKLEFEKIIADNL